MAIGSFVSGFAEGIGSGMSWKAKKLEIEEMKKLRDEEAKLKKEIAVEMKDFTSKVDKIIQDGVTDQELLQLNTMYLSARAELQNQFEGLVTFINQGHADEARSQMEYISSLTENLMGSTELLEAGDINTMYDSIMNTFTSEKAMQYGEVAKSQMTTMMETRQKAEAKRQEEAAQARQELIDQGTYYPTAAGTKAAYPGENVDVKLNKDMGLYYPEYKGGTPKMATPESSPGVTGAGGGTGVTGEDPLAGFEKVEKGEGFSDWFYDTALGKFVQPAVDWATGNSTGGNQPPVENSTGAPGAENTNPFAGKSQDELKALAASYPAGSPQRIQVLEYAKSQGWF
jgi:DNA-binding protein H-NS